MNDAQTTPVVRMTFGSALYGTRTPKSDDDFKGVFLPARNDVLLGRIPRSLTYSTGKAQERNDAGDVDTEEYSLHYFLTLACQGQTVALDMMHAPEPMLLQASDVWRTIAAERSRFYTRSLHAFVGYARKQAAKYGIRGSRLQEAMQVRDLLAAHAPDSRLEDLWEELPDGEHCRKLLRDEHGFLLFEICGRKLNSRERVRNALIPLEKFIATYGERAELARRNEGIDWKSVSHALRAAFQARELLRTGTMTFPRPEAEYLIAVKSGWLDYTSQVAPDLESLMSEVEDLSRASSLPEKVDRRWWDDWLAAVMREYMEMARI